MHECGKSTMERRLFMPPGIAMLSPTDRMRNTGARGRPLTKNPAQSKVLKYI